jgi:GDP-4-dehydro-6-deoxy-D-mannose reductase
VRVAVTGASGFVGGYMVGHLDRLGHEVVALIRRPETQWGVHTETMDIEIYDSVLDCISRVKPDAVVHCAAQASVSRSWDDPDRTYRTNILGTGNLLEVLRGRPVKLLLVGSAQQYGRSPLGRPLKESAEMAPRSPYAVSKLAQEHMGLTYHRRYGLEVIATRPFNHTGPGQSPEYAVGSFCSQVAAMERGVIRELQVGNLEAVRDLLDVRDVVAAYGRLLESGKTGEVYNVCSGRGVRMGDLLATVMEMAGLPKSASVISQAEGDSDVLVGDPSRICSELRWTPGVALDRSLAESLDWYRNRMRAGPA